ncbi:MAG: RnfABCDGE type electron transport complex subunit D, partial [Clostridia bacterium]|nr:RnfABCDGE type electron transport complex subunit D [Clostridia bacterium]
MYMEKLIVSSSPHVKSQRTTHFFMQDVILALIPVLIAGIVFFSFRAFFVVLISV